MVLSTLDNLIGTKTKLHHHCQHFSPHLDHLRCLQQTQFRSLADTLRRNQGAGKSGGAEKMPGGLTGGVNHQVQKPKQQEIQNKLSFITYPKKLEYRLQVQLNMEKNCACSKRLVKLSYVR